MHDDLAQPDHRPRVTVPPPTMVAEPRDVPAPHARPPMPAWRQAALSLYWFATQAQWSAILLILLPQQAKLIGGEASKGATLGAIVLIGAFISMLAAPIFGAWSDRVRTRWGRRMPFIVLGTVGNAVGLVVLAFIPAVPGALVPYIIGFSVIQLFSNLATAPYSAMIPDAVSEEQRGSASGWMGLMFMLGNFAGIIVGAALQGSGGATAAYLALAVILLLGMVGTVAFVKEPEPTPTPPFNLRDFLRGLVEPFGALDFRWVFLTRFLVMMGMFTVQEFLLYYMHDMIALGDDAFVYNFFGLARTTGADNAVAFFAVMLLVGAVISTFFAGALSDRYGRKRMVYISGALQGAVALVLIFVGRFDLVVLLGLIYGLGYGAYQAVDWALVSDVLPSAADHAKDMGLWHIAVTLPQVMAAPIAGVLLDRFTHVGQAHGVIHLGYYVIFAMAVVYFMLGTVLVAKIKGAR